MRNNRKEIQFTAAAAAGVWGISLPVFLIIFSTVKTNVLLLVILYGLWNLVIFSTAYLAMSRNVNRVLGEVDRCIQSMIDGSPEKRFSEQEESLLGKFQSLIVKLYQILEGARDRERKQHEELSNLVADFVHQVNTPLTNIQMYSGFLMQDDLNKEEKERICDVIDAQVEKLGWFAEGFTKTVRLEDDIRRLAPEKQPVMDVVLGAIDQITPKAKKNRNEIRMSGDREAQAVYDRRWTEEALFNILDNAVKYGEPGMPVCVTVTSYELFVRIDIMNYGNEIPGEEYPRIFMRYYRGGNAVFVKEGIGLGLYLSREIITDQGGYIKVSSAKGMGDVFSVFLKKR